LAILAVRALLPTRRARAWIVGLAVLLTLPGIAYMLDWMRDVVRAGGQAHYLRDEERRALAFLDTSPERGGVLATSYLGPLVPAFTDRESWVGHPSWTRDFDQRVRETDALFAGRLPRDRALTLVRSSGARFVLTDCGRATLPLDALRPALHPVRRFGCASVYRIQRDVAARASGATS
jgi:hypothetical protein